MQRLIGLLCLLLCGWAQAQSAPPAPPGTEPNNPCAFEGAERDPRCGEQRRPAGEPVVYPGEINVPVVGPGGGQAPRAAPPLTPVSKGGSSSSGGLGNLDGRALLVLVVIAAAALPAIVYGFDDDADAESVAQYDAFHVAADAWGGAMTTDSSNPSGLAGVRGRVSHARFGVETSFEGTPYSPDWRSANMAALFRLVPKQHIEIAVSVGGRWSTLNGDQRFDGELALPHRYVFFRNEGQSGGIEVRPAVLVSGKGADVRLDTALVVPIGSVASINIGARFFTYDFAQVNLAAVGGVSARF